MANRIYEFIDLHGDKMRANIHKFLNKLNSGLKKVPSAKALRTKSLKKKKT